MTRLLTSTDSVLRDASWTVTIRLAMWAPPSLRVGGRIDIPELVSLQFDQPFVAVLPRRLARRVVLGLGVVDARQIHIAFHLDHPPEVEIVLRRLRHLHARTAANSQIHVGIEQGELGADGAVAE